MADELSGPYDSYLKTLSEWPTAVGSSNQWFLWFDVSSVNALVNSLNQKLYGFESNFGLGDGWDINENTVLKLTDGEYHFRNRIGCVFAKQVNLPSDAFEASNRGLDYGGWMPPATSSNRQKYNKLKITFLETNASFVDFVIKPWLILSSYYGFMSRRANSIKNVKCTFCDVHFLARTESKQAQDTRKCYRFQNIVPVSIDAEQYSYLSDDMKTTSVEFVYDQYYVRDTRSFANLERTFNTSR
jgi:hypothetical protein